jgi:hypothetical protein
VRKEPRANNVLHLGRKAWVQRRLKHSAMEVHFEAHFSQADSFAVRSGTDGRAVGLGN